MHAAVAALAAVLVLTLAPGDAPAADPCKAACKSTRKGCLREAAETFAAARKGCRGLEPSPRKTCRGTAFVDRSNGRAACRTAFRSCRATCDGGGGGGDRCRGSSFGDWRATVNGFRGLAGLPPVAENPDWSAGAAAHAKYAVKEDVVGHSENPISPFFSEAGLLAAQNGNVAGTSDAHPPVAWAVDLWMTGPFHAIGVLDPVLATSGYGAYSEADGGDVQSAAVLDVIRGRTGGDLGLPFPVVFPGNGTTLPLGRYAGGEFPDPLASCPGYTPPTGPPLLVLAGPSGTLTALGVTSLLRDGTPVAHCVYDGGTYVNPDAGSQSTARNVLAARSAVVVLPREPLVQGAVYDVSVVMNGAVVGWRFTHDCP
ncbi:MAG: hypothetical protein KIT14_03255 [bacterium]|nr:hypothetical protein [bacterium]